MTEHDIFTKLKDRFPDDVQSLEEVTGDNFIVVSAKAIDKISAYLVENSELNFDMLTSLGAVDLASNYEKVQVVYHLFSTANRHKIVIKVEVPKNNAHVPTVEKIWKTANWHERETYDLFGIHFDGHSDLRRILLPDDWEGYPLRKDYTEPDIYRGMKVPY